MNRILFILPIVFLACTSPEEQEAENLSQLRDSLTTKIMAVHDDVMPKHMEIQMLKKKAEEQLQTLADDSLAAAQMTYLRNLLDSAYRSMNTWMYEYEPLSEDMTREEILDYYRVEIEKVEAVRDLMLESLQEASDKLAE